MTKDLQEKAIDIKGKQYVLVSDRIIYFNETYKNGCIKTQLVSTPDADMVVVKAQVTPDASSPDRAFTGYSQATWGEGMVNKTAALENAETSAVGRALAMMGIGVIDSVASADEMNKAGAVNQPSTSKPSVQLECDYHHVPMFQTAKMKSPAHRDEVRGWCNGDGYKDEKEAWKNKVSADKKELPTIQVDDEAEEVASSVPF